MKEGTRGVEATTGLVQLGWPGGALTLRYTGIATVDKEAQDEIRNVMQQFPGELPDDAGLVRGRGREPGRDTPAPRRSIPAE